MRSQLIGGGRIVVYTMQDQQSVYLGDYQPLSQMPSACYHRDRC